MRVHKILILFFLINSSCLETEKDECVGSPTLLNPLSESMTSISFRQDTLVINLSGDSLSVFEHTADKIMNFQFFLLEDIYPDVDNKINRGSGTGYEALITGEVNTLTGTVLAIDACDAKAENDFELEFDN